MRSRVALKTPKESIQIEAVLLSGYSDTPL